MIVKVLVENTKLSSEFGCKHGLSLYIETLNNKILFDLGEDQLFLDSANKLGVDISEVDTVIISHGHKDHGGALAKFLEKNSKARVYIRETAFEKHYAKVLGLNVSIGLDPSLKFHPQVILTEDKLEINKELYLFSKLKKGSLYPRANNSLYMEKDGKKLMDDFGHEQYLIISEGEYRVLVSGCSHLGIVNIKSEAEKIVGRELNYIFGGFHLSMPSLKKSEDDKLIEAIGKELKNGKSYYFTGHCTGENAFRLLKDKLGERISHISTGLVISL
ncbi:MAG: MBL fold metallo-hydrolase [Filifactoraceae bacterium]